MCECHCHDGYTLDTLIPKVGIITDIRQETPDVKTFRVNAPEGGKLFEHMPGQCAMVCAPGVSEAMFSITSSLTPGAQTIAHCPGICSNNFPPSGAFTRNVLTSGVS